MVWRVELTPEAAAFFGELDDVRYEAIASAMRLLRRRGPALGRPAVDRVRGSRHHNMKELRSIGGHVRALFAFDPRRVAVVLVMGDKSGDWRRWYERAIPLADSRFDAHLAKLRKEPQDG